MSAHTSSGHWKYAGVAAVATSFLVYLVPLVGPHAFWLVGEVLRRELMARERAAAWIAADFGVVLAAQALLGALCYFAYRRKPLLGAAASIVVMLVLAPALNVLLLATIPARFLIEPSNEPEKSSWAQECTVQSASLAPLTATVNSALAAAGEALLRFDRGGYGVLRAPGCAVAPIPMPSNPNVTPVSAIPGGTVLAAEWINARNQYRYWLVSNGKPEALDWLDKGPEATAVLSLDGTALGWLRRIPTSEPPMATELHIAARNASSPRAVPLRKVGLGSYVLLALDTRGGQALLARNLDEFIIIGNDGEVRWGPFKPPGVEPQPQTFVRFESGWAAWDAYREGERYRVAWSFPAGTGSHAIPKGRAINSAAASPAGEYIAYSVTGSYSIGSVPDFVALMRTSDGAEVFRKYLPRYARSGVAFLGSDRFAYFDIEGSHSVVRVLRIQR